jgi:hypothetical protein
LLPTQPQEKAWTWQTSQSFFINPSSQKQWKLQEVADLPKFAKDPVYVSWYEGIKKRMEPVGRDSEHALKMLNKKVSSLRTKQPVAKSKKATKAFSNSQIKTGSGRRSASSMNISTHSSMPFPTR